MDHIRNHDTGRQLPQAVAALALAAASGGLLAAAMAGSPSARADNPYADIVNDVQNVVTLGEADYSAAAADFSTVGGTNAGLIAEIVGFDNTFISPADYTLLGLTAAGTGTDFSPYSFLFELTPGLFPLTAAGEQATAAADLSTASSQFSGAVTELLGGNDFTAVTNVLLGGYFDVLAGQSETLAGLFSLGI